jgi:murein DD-endopeptidase MepM/ murein hydrolase activator NlpD
VTIAPILNPNVVPTEVPWTQDMSDLVPAVKNTSICSVCGYGYYNEHYGIDYSTGGSVPVYARGRGEVVVAGISPFSQWAGVNHVIIKYTQADGTVYYQSAYHMSSSSVNIGDFVDANTQIGWSGASGNAPGGVHYHDELITCSLDTLFGGGWGPGCYINPSSVGQNSRANISDSPPLSVNAVKEIPPTTTAITSNTLPGFVSSYILNTTINSNLSKPFTKWIEPYTLPLLNGNTGTGNSGTSVPVPGTVVPDVTKGHYLGDGEYLSETTTSYMSKASFIELPADWNMDSCERVITQGGSNDTIAGAIPIKKCTNGRSEGNRTIACVNRWVLAYAETIAVENFPLLNLLSSAEPTESNNVRPACYYNMVNNVTKDEFKKDNNGNEIPGEIISQALNYGKDFSELLKFSGGGKEEVDLGYPRLGTAVSCTALNWDNQIYPPKLNIQNYNNSLLNVPPQKIDGNAATTNGPDSFWVKLLDTIKSIFTFKNSIKSQETINIKNVNTIRTDGLDYACGNVIGMKITKVNESDGLLPERQKRVVINQNKEVFDLTNTQICDMQYINGSVSGLTICEMTNGQQVRGSSGETMFGQGYLKYRTYRDINGDIIKECLNQNITFCGRQFDCEDSISSLYSQCKSIGASVKDGAGDVSGNPIYIYSSKGYDNLTLPGMNMALYNAKFISGDVNSPFDVLTGENIGIRLPVTRITFDLNTQVLPYFPDKSKADNQDPKAIKSSLSSLISYKKTDYNYKYPVADSSFAVVGGAAGVYKYDYYFPYIGKLPYVYERLSVINSNQNESKTGETLRYQPIVPNDIVYDPQLKYCSQDGGTGTEDCYTNDPCSDSIVKYLEGNNLTFFQCKSCQDSSGGTSGNEPGSKIDGLQSPVDDNSTSRISFRFADQDKRPDTLISCQTNSAVPICHTGLDIAGYASDIYSAGAGRVVEAGFDGSYGNKIVIEHTLTDGTKKWTLYAHLASMNVKVGDMVTENTKIGYMGNTSTKTFGVHLHFEIRNKNAYTNGAFEDPLQVYNTARGSSSGGSSGGTSGGTSGETSGENSASCSIQSKFIQASIRYSGDISRIKRVVFHHTVAPFQAVINYFKSGSGGVSAHYVLSKTGELVQMVEDQDIAYTTQNNNSDTINIEIEHLSTEPFTEEQYKVLSSFAATMAKKYNIPLDRQHFIGHKEAGGELTLCPANLDIDRIVNDAKSGNCGGTSGSSTNSQNCPTSNSNFGDKPSSLNCLIKRVADSINSGGERISAEAIYAVAKTETKLNCSPTAGTWTQGAANKAECTGDPDQIAWPNRNASTSDIRGLTQISPGTFKVDALSFDEAGLVKCIEDIGSSTTIDGDFVDGLLGDSRFTRKKVGQALCMTALMMAKYGTKHNGGAPASIEKWNQASTIITEACVDYNRGPNDNATCGQQCQAYFPQCVANVKEAVNNNIFAGCN